MAATGAKQAEADLRVIQATDGIEELGRRFCPLCCVPSDKSILTHCSPEKFEVGLDPALALAICEQSRQKVSRKGWVASRAETDDFRLVQVEMQPKIR